MTDGPEDNGFTPQPGDQYTTSDFDPLTNRGKGPEPAATTRHLQGKQGKKARRKLVLGWRSEGILLPLTLLCLIIYLMATGWFSTSTPASEKAPAASATPQATATRSVPTASPAFEETPVVIALRSSPEPVNKDEAVEAQLDEARLKILSSQFEAAVDMYAALVRQMPDDARPQAGWAWALILDDLPEQALPHAHQAMVLDPVNAETAAVLARVYLDLGEETRALGMARSAVENGSTNARAHAVLAMACLLTGDLEQARQEATRAVELDPGDLEAHRAMAQVYEADGDPTRAVESLHEGTNLLPDLWLTHYELAEALLSAQDYRGAISSFRLALNLRPKASILAGIGKAYYGLGQDAAARTFLERSLASGGRDADSYAFLAAVNARLGDCGEARTFYQTILAQNQADSLALAAQQLCESSPSPVAEAPEATPLPEETPPAALPELAGRIAFPAWSYVQERYDVYVADLASGGTTLVLEGMHQPAFSPDGGWLVGNGERQQQMNLILVPAAGTDLREITRYIEDALPAWSPNGQAVAFSSNRDSDRQSRIYIIDEIWQASEGREDRVLRSDLYEVLGSYPAWTADGRVVYSGCDFRASPIRCGLFALWADPGEGEPRQLTDHPDDSAPDVHGDRLAFMSRRDGNWEVYVTGVAGGGLQRLTDDQANDGLPTWSPDGQAIAFVSDRGGVWAVWVMSPDGSNCRKLFDIGGGGLLLDWQHERISWAP